VSGTPPIVEVLEQLARMESRIEVLERENAGLRQENAVLRAGSPVMRAAPCDRWPCRTSGSCMNRLVAVAAVMTSVGRTAVAGVFGLLVAGRGGGSGWVSVCFLVGLRGVRRILGAGCWSAGRRWCRMPRVCGRRPGMWWRLRCCRGLRMGVWSCSGLVFVAGARLRLLFRMVCPGRGLCASRSWVSHRIPLAHTAVRVVAGIAPVCKCTFVPVL
jgi:hypothetical protein